MNVAFQFHHYLSETLVEAAVVHLCLMAYRKICFLFSTFKESFLIINLFANLSHVVIETSEWKLLVPSANVLGSNSPDALIDVRNKLERAKYRACGTPHLFLISW